MNSLADNHTFNEAQTHTHFASDNLGVHWEKLSKTYITKENY